MLAVTLVIAFALSATPFTSGQVQKWYEAGEYDKVVRAVGEHPDPKLVYLAGSSCEKLSRLEDARRLYQQLAAGGDSDPWALIGRAAAQLATGSAAPSAEALAQAGQAVDLAINVAPQLAAAHYQRGLVDGHWRDYASAADAFSRATTLDPAFAYAHYYAGLSYSRIEQPDQMAIHFERFLTLAPDAPEVGQVQSLMRSVRGRR